MACPDIQLRKTRTRGVTPPVDGAWPIGRTEKIGQKEIDAFAHTNSGALIYERAIKDSGGCEELWWDLLNVRRESLRSRMLVFRSGSSDNLRCSISTELGPIVSSTTQPTFLNNDPGPPALQTN
jgi:hypothetical protein